MTPVSDKLRKLLECLGDFQGGFSVITCQLPHIAGGKLRARQVEGLENRLNSLGREPNDYAKGFRMSLLPMQEMGNTTIREPLTHERVYSYSQVIACRQLYTVQALEKFGIQDDTKELLNVADRNGDGQIDYQEFVLLMRETNKELNAAGGNSGLLRGKLSVPPL